MSKGASGLDHRAPLRLDPLAVVRVDLVEPAVAELLRFRNAGVINPLAAEIVAGAFGPGGPDQLRQGFHQLPELALFLAAAPPPASWQR